MSLYDFVYNLQRKSERTKKGIWTALLIFSFIILSAFWVFMFKKQVYLISANSNGETETVGGNSNSLIGPAAAIIEGIKDLKSDISQKIGKLESAPDTKERQVYELPEN
jgi:hypothetical protein